MGFILCCLYIHHVWNRHFDNSVDNWMMDRKASNYYLLVQYNFLERKLPQDERFISLYFSAFRHGFIFLVFSMLIYFVNNPWLNHVLLYLHFFKTLFKIWIQRIRSEYVKAAQPEIQHILGYVLKATRAVVIYCIILELSINYIYFIRPY